MELSEEQQRIYYAVVQPGNGNARRRLLQLGEILEREPTELEAILGRQLTPEEAMLEYHHQDDLDQKRLYTYHLHAQQVEKTGRDALTGLYNRARFEEELRSEIARVDAIHGGAPPRRNEKPPYDVSLLALDIDNFKRINDTYGHPEGDKVLKRVSEIIQDKKLIRDDDIVARVGGEEFVIILPYTSMVIGAGIAERVRKGIEVGCKDNYHAATVSVGVANYKEVCDSPENLKRFADIALYKAKEAGRNRVCLYKKP